MTTPELIASLRGQADIMTSLGDLKKAAVLNEAVEMLERFNTSTYADMAIVVRCKDCKHYMRVGRYGLFCRRRIRSGIEYRTKADDFCSYGQRKDKHTKGSTNHV